MSRFPYDRRHNPRLMQPPGMRSFVVSQLGDRPLAGIRGSATMTYEEVESAFVGWWAVVLHDFWMTADWAFLNRMWSRQLRDLDPKRFP